MEDVSRTAEDSGRGDLEAVADAAIILAESSTARDANTSARDEVSAPATSLATTSCSEFHSARIESMLSSMSEFETELTYRTAHSIVHWSELSHERSSSSEESESGSGESLTGSGGQSDVDHLQYFQVLQKDAIWGGFCSKVADVVLGKKLGEGAQAIIYEAQVKFAIASDQIEREFGMRCAYVVKVMKSGYALEDLHRQWPGGVATLQDKTLGLMTFALYGSLVKDHATGRNRFGFVMCKRWGDLRKLIDLRMERNNAQGPPFTVRQVKNIMFRIAFEMSNLHKRGIIHRDLKAANVLVFHSVGKENCNLMSTNDDNVIFPYVADWECSVGVVGTGFWRAPEILQQLKDRTPSSELLFTKEMDVYSFAMTCYEIVTGLLPFERLPYIEVRDAILDGARPKLPQDMDPVTNAIITSCWHPNPSYRPSFEGVLDIFKIFCD